MYFSKMTLFRQAREIERMTGVPIETTHHNSLSKLTEDKNVANENELGIYSFKSTDADLNSSGKGSKVSKKLFRSSLHRKADS